MYKYIFTFVLITISNNILSQRFISPLKFEYSEASFKKVTDYIDYDVKRSVSLYDKEDSLTIKTLTHYSWEAFYNLLVASDTLLIKQITQQDLNILKYQSIWSSYYHVKSNGITYSYGDHKNINYKYLTESLLDTENSAIDGE